MKISPIEIRKKEFEKAFRGYEKEEVDAFLQTLSQEWEKVAEDHKEHKKKIESLEKEITRMREVEASLFKTLKSAEDTTTNIIEQSNRTAELHVREAQMNAESLLSEARNRARAMIEDAEMEVKHILDDLQIESRNIEKEYDFINNQKENLFEDIQGYMKDMMDKISKFEQKTNRATFEAKLKTIKNIGGQNPIKNLEITNNEAVINPTPPKSNTTQHVNTYINSHVPTPNVKKEEPLLEEALKEQKKSDGSFFDSIL